MGVVDGEGSEKRSGCPTEQVPTVTLEKVPTRFLLVDGRDVPTWSPSVRHGRTGRG